MSSELRESRWECATAKPVRLVGGRIPDFLGGVPATAAEAILAWHGDCGTIRAAMEASQTGAPISAATASSLQAVGILDSQQHLTGLGEKFAYHLHEYHRQAGGDGIRDVLLEKAELGPGSRVLDVGCGAGQTLMLLGGRGPMERVGLDVDLESLALGAQIADDAKEKIDFVRASATSLPFPKDSFSHVVSRVTLNYVHQRSALAEQVRVLRPGGFLYCRAEGPGYDIRRLAGTRQLRRLASYCHDFLLGMGLAVIGRQATPGRFPAPGRSCVTRARLTRFLQHLGCTILHTAVCGRYAGVPAAIELLAQKHVSLGRTGSTDALDAVRAGTAA